MKKIDIRSRFQLKGSGRAYLMSYRAVENVRLNGRHVPSPTTVWDDDLITCDKSDKTGFLVFKVENGNLIED